MKTQRLVEHLRREGRSILNEAADRLILLASEAEGHKAARDAALAELRAARSVVVRPTVWAFAQMMEATLRRHDHKKGGRQNWQRDRAADLHRRLMEEVKELDDAMNLCNASCTECVDEAVDVANFAMMLSDKLIPLTPLDADDVACDTAELTALRDALAVSRADVARYNRAATDLISWWDSKVMVTAQEGTEITTARFRALREAIAATDANALAKPEVTT